MRRTSPKASIGSCPTTGGGLDAPLLVIENSAGGGDTMGSTLEELAEIAEAIAGQRVAPARVGFCLDAAHAWGAGYRISEPTRSTRSSSGSTR